MYILAYCLSSPILLILSFATWSVLLCILKLARTTKLAAIYTHSRFKHSTMCLSDLYCCEDALVSSDATDLNNCTSFAGCNNTDIQLVGGRNSLEGHVEV